jgi:molybdenum transport protein
MSLVLTDAQLQRLLADDVPHGDLTTTALGIAGQPARIDFFARQALTLAASEEAARLLELAGARVDFLLPSGSQVGAQGRLLGAHGSAGALHHAWKVAQTLMEYTCGIASAAHAITRALREAGLGTPVACTRKSFPGTKAVAIKAVLAGGALMHRLGLSETLLVFAEHRAFLAPQALAADLARLKTGNPEKKLVAEVASVAEALQLAQAGVDVLQLEKFSPAAVADCRATLAAHGLKVCLAAAGGVNAANAVTYAQAGADLLVSSAPYFAPPADVQVRLGPWSPPEPAGQAPE